MSIPGFAEWRDTPLGRYMVAWEQSKVDALVADVFGFHAVQVGLPECNYLRNNRIGFQLLCGQGTGAGLICEPFALPLETQSVDLVILPHVLEFSPHPHQVLREVERILMPEGQVMITGFNPVSLWGLRRLLARKHGVFPWQGQFMSVRRLKDWLQLLGFETQGGAFGAYIPPVTQQHWIDRFRFMDEAGDRWWPIGGGAYVIQAIKRVAGMRIIEPNWRLANQRRKNLAPVAQRGARDKHSSTGWQ